MRKVSDYKLNMMRIWVCNLDVPMNWRTEVVVRAFCVHLGTILQTKLDGDTGNYVRVRVAILVNRPLETTIAMFAKVKEHKTKVEFQIQFEKLPNICYSCSYLGNQEKSCDGRGRGGAPSLKFSGKLHCTPSRRFGRQTVTVRAKANPTTYRGLEFSSESTGSSGHGRGERGMCRSDGGSMRRPKEKTDNNTGNPAVDEMLSAKMQAMPGTRAEAATIGVGDNAP
ncbi:hypothetical protein D1007_22286 [Hordeum vulgare]|nr:hypothetical protein D1007_22286 [Hordeum vulgare]